MERNAGAALNVQLEQMKQEATMQLLSHMSSNFVQPNGTILSMDITKDVEDLLTGKLFDSLQSINIRNEISPDVTVADSVSAAQAIINEGLREAQTLGQISSTLQSYMKNFFGANLKQITRDYAGAIINALAQKNEVSYGTIATSIRRMILTTTNDKFFKINDAGDPTQNIVNAIEKILLTIDSLPDGLYGGGGPAGGESRIAQKVGQKISSFLQSLQATIAKTAVGRGFISGMRKFKDLITPVHEKVNKPLKASGKQISITKIASDSYLEELFGGLDSAGSAGINTSTVNVVTSDDTVIGRLDLIYNNNMVNSASINSMITILPDKTSELLLSLPQLLSGQASAASTVEDLIALLGAHDEYEESAGEYIFNDLKYAAAYKNYIACVIQVLTGLTGDYYLSANGKIHTMGDFQLALYNALANPDNIDSIKQLVMGQDANSFAELNAWVGDKKRRSIALAQQRSAMYGSSASAMLNEIRMDSKISLYKLVALAKMNGGLA